MIRYTRPEVLWDVKAQLGEGPVWVSREQALWFTNIKGHQLFRLDPATGAQTVFDTPEQTGFILPAKGGGFVAGRKSGLYHFDPETKSFVLLGDPEPDKPDNRFNDGTVGPDGAIWFGTMDDHQVAPTGALYRYKDGRFTCHDRDYVITNGPCFSPDGATLYHVDTLKKIIYAFHVNDDQTLSGKRLFAALSDQNGGVDGIVCDSAGHIWVSLYGGAGIWVYAPDGTRILCIDMPVSNVTKVAFGGPELKTLFVTTAWGGLNEEERAQQPHAGSLFVIETDIAGLPQPEAVI